MSPIKCYCHFRGKKVFNSSLLTTTTTKKLCQHEVVLCPRESPAGLKKKQSTNFVFFWSPLSPAITSMDVFINCQIVIEWHFSYWKTNFGGSSTTSYITKKETGKLEKPLYFPQMFGIFYRLPSNQFWYDTVCIRDLDLLNLPSVFWCKAQVNFR